MNHTLPQCTKVSKFVGLPADDYLSDVVKIFLSAVSVVSTFVCLCVCFS